MWLELVGQTRQVVLRGEQLQLFAPFETGPRLTMGRDTSDLVVEWSRPLVLEVHGERVELQGGPTPLRLVAGDTFEVSVGVVLRVVGVDAAASCGWPADVTPPLTVPTDDGLRVFGDQLLERGYPVGQRFTSRDPKEDKKWLGAISADAVTSWRVGVVDGLRLTKTPASPWALVTALRRTAITRCLRRLTVGPMAYEDSLIRILEALVAQGGLPWLEQLEVIDTEPPLPGSDRKRDLAVLVARVAVLHPALLQPPSLTFVPVSAPRA